MEGCKQMGHFWNLSNYREALIQPLKVNSPKTKNPQPHVVHKNALEWSTRASYLALYFKEDGERGENIFTKSRGRFPPFMKENIDDLVKIWGL